jgi:hypothetical protein
MRMRVNPLKLAWNTALLLLPVCAAFAQNPTPGPGQGFPTADANGAWTFFTDPRAIYYKGQREKLYLSFITRQGTTRVWSYDYASGAVDTATLHVGLEQDDHDVPGLYMRKDGRITAFYSRHTVDHNVYVRTTVNPEDIHSWGAERTWVFSENTTYANPFRLSKENDRVYFFNRVINWHPTATASDDDGATWGTPSQWIGGGAARPYVRYRGDGVSRVHFGFTDGHPRDVPNNSIYYMYYEAGAFHHADGTQIKTVSQAPVEPREADKVYDGSTKGKAWIWDIALDAQNRPVMVFSVMPTDSDHRYYYARWNGSKWIVTQMCVAARWFPQTPAGTTEREPQYSGGIILNPQDPSEVFLSRPPNGTVGGIFEIERWYTGDMGVTWTSEAITSKSAKNNVRPIIPWTVPGQTNPRRTLLWMYGDYTHYTDYNTGIKYAFLSAPTSLSPSRIGGLPPVSPASPRFSTPAFPFSGTYFNANGTEEGRGLPVLRPRAR